jgi:glycosyltransferase involved in cell wall biosynthesis
MIAARDKPVVSDATPPSSAAILDEIESCRPDAVVVGNLHGAGLSADLLGRITARWPTLYFLHDQWLLTGRCAYSEQCTQYLTGCDHTCPTPDEYPRLLPEKISESWSMKRRVLNSDNPPLLLGNSRWMCDFARRALSGIDTPSKTPAAPIESARLGVPLDVFRPHDRKQSREALGLPPDRFIIMIAGSPLTAPRKGLAHLATALDELNLPDVLVVGAGSGNSGDLPPIRGMHLIGMINEPRELAMLFSAADLFVGPSLEEAFGQVFIEAAACGTPSIGYPVGGVPEAIADGITGRLAAAVEPTALAKAILELYRDDELRHSMGVWSRIHAENTWSLPAAYRQFRVALDRAGWRARLGLRPKINFEPRRPTPRPIQHVNRILADWSAAGMTQNDDSGTSGFPAIFPGHNGHPHARHADEDTAHEWDVSIRIPNEITCEMKNARMMDALKSLADKGVQRVAIYGAGQHTWDVARTLHDAPVDICGILDDRAEGSLAGWPVLPPESADALGAQAVVLSSDLHEERMWQNRAVFRSQGIPVVRLYGSGTVATTRPMREIKEVVKR